MSQRFTTEGDYDVILTAVEVVEPRFDNMVEEDPNAFEIKITGTTVDGFSGDYFAEMSSRIVAGTSKNAGRRRFEVTMELLQKLGFVGQDLSSLSQQLVNKPCVFAVKQNNSGYLNVAYINFGQTSVALATHTANAKLAAMFGGAPTQTPQFGSVPNQTPPAQQQFQQPAQQQFQQPAQQGNPFQQPAQQQFQQPAPGFPTK